MGNAVGFFFKKLLSALLLPPFGPLLLMLLGAGLVSRARFSGRVLFLLGATLAFALSLPVVANWSQWPFEVQNPPIREIPLNTQAIVVLGGGRDLGASEWGGESVSAATLARLRYAAWLSRLSHQPLLVTGGKPDGGKRSEAALMAQVLTQDFGVPVRWQEGASIDTTENAEMTRALLEPDHINSVLLVTDVVHMPRAMKAFQDAGFAPVAAPVGYAVHSPLTWQSFLPDPHAYMRSSWVLHELLGMGWQRTLEFIKSHRS